MAPPAGSLNRAADTRRLSTAQLIAGEAQARGCEVEDFSDLFEGFFELRHGGRQEIIYYSSSERVSHIAYRLCELKPLTTHLLRRAGFPVPEEIVTSSAAAAAAFLRTHGRVVIKPLQGTGGAGITPDVRSETELTRAMKRARQATALPGEQRVLCQQHVDGRDFRLLVIDKKHVLAMERIPAGVTGDGTHTVAELVAERNQTMPDPYQIRLEEDAHDLLAQANLTAESVVPRGTAVRLAKVANAHAGGLVCDVTDELSAAVRTLAQNVAAHFNLPVVGIDWLAPDITSGQGVIIELNATPDLSIHYYPDKGERRDSIRLFVDMLFPETAKE